MSSSALVLTAFGYGVCTTALIAYNLRWRYIGDILGRRTPKKLPFHRVQADEKHTKDEKKPLVVLLHGMWHDASYFLDTQFVLQKYGYSSVAIDLLPGERLLPGFSQKEILADLEATLDDDDDDDSLILLGHSQGGLVVQSCLLNSPTLRKRSAGCILLGTYPLGLRPSQKLMQQPRNMYNQWGYLGICLVGKLLSLRYLQHIFLLPTTDPSLLTEYTRKILTAPSDGLITMSHFFQRGIGVISSTVPTLVLGAAQDIIFPPHLLESAFRARFPQCTSKVISGQAHCFMDPVANKGESMPEEVVKWLEKVTT